MSDMDGSLVERRRRRAEGEEGESYFVSMSDLMAGVLFLFIILLTYFALQLRQTTDDVLHPKPKTAPQAAAAAAQPSSQATAQALLQIEADREAAKNAPTKPTAAPPPDDRTLAIRRLAADLKAHGVSAVIDEANGTIHLPNDALFNPGGAGPSPGGASALHALGEALARTLPCYSYSAALPKPGDCPATGHHLAAVFIEGHADAPGGQSAGFGLSVMQASTAFQQLIGAEPRLTSLTTLPSGGQPLLSVSGYGPTRPAPAGSGAPNNRLDVKLVMAAS